VCVCVVYITVHDGYPIYQQHKLLLSRYYSSLLTLKTARETCTLSAQSCKLPHLLPAAFGCGFISFVSGCQGLLHSVVYGCWWSCVGALEFRYLIRVLQETHIIALY